MADVYEDGERVFGYRLNATACQLKQSSGPIHQDTYRIVSNEELQVLHRDELWLFEYCGIVGEAD